MITETSAIITVFPGLLPRVIRLSPHFQMRRLHPDRWLLAGLMFTVNAHAGPVETLEQPHYLIAEDPKWERVAPPKLLPG